MKDAKMLLIIKNCSIELAEKIQKLINDYNAEREYKPHIIKDIRKEIAERAEKGN